MHWLGEHLWPHFPLQPSQGNINYGKKDVKDNRKSLMVGQNAAKAAETKKSAENHPDLPSHVKSGS
ncbi:MAG: hypothetical protein MUP73_04350, partial [Dehalococcoidia bacterium]|nr:hypothetical protein [Dehalococcoidia bacterium]